MGATKAATALLRARKVMRAGALTAVTGAAARPPARRDAPRRSATGGAAGDTAGNNAHGAGGAGASSGDGDASAASVMFTLSCESEADTSCIPRRVTLPPLTDTGSTLAPAQAPALNGGAAGVAPSCTSALWVIQNGSCLWPSRCGVCGQSRLTHQEQFVRKQHVKAIHKPQTAPAMTLTFCISCETPWLRHRQQQHHHSPWRT